MPTDAGGTYTLPSGSAATTGTTILASEHNTPLNDIASALTARLPVDGSKGMSGPLRVADGTVAAPGVALGSETGTGFYKIGSGQWGLSIAGTLTATFDATGITIPNGLTYSKFQNVTSGALLGNFSGISAIPSEVTLGTGLTTVPKSSTVTITIASPGVVTWNAHGLSANAPVVLSTTGILPTGLSAGTVYYVVSPATNTFQLSATPGGSAINTSGAQSGTHTATSTTVIAAPAFPPSAAFKNLSVKVATNTTVAVVADYIVVTNGTAFQTLAFNTTINFATTGAGGLDTGALTTTLTFYAIWAIAKADGTTSCIASTSGTAPSPMPTGYTYKARIGWVRSASGSANLMGTWQFGRETQYVLGLAQTSAIPIMYNANTAGVLTAVSVSNFVPPTASKISVLCQCPAAQSYSLCAPNNFYALGSSNSPPPVSTLGSSAGFFGINTPIASMVLESTNIYFASGGSGASSSNCVSCFGWTDNI